MQTPEIHLLHRSEFYQIRNYKCFCTECNTTKEEVVNRFHFCFVRSGYFQYRVFRRELDVHVGRVLISKEGSTHFTHHIDNQPDVCSVFEFTSEFLQSLREQYKTETSWFFSNNDLHSLVLNCNAEIDYLHHHILTRVNHGFDQLLIDDWVLRLVDKVMRILGNRNEVQPIPESSKRYHLVTIEKAKEYLLTHFDQNVTLQQLASHCCVSIFHFSRLFKSIMRVSPYQYLSGIRLHHAKVLLESTHQTVTQIAFQCGYNSLEHFVTAYKQRYQVSPSAHRPVSI
ncbi:MAG: helix-turn-helix domain-containing protein [Bacteroidota bacterium]